MMRKMISPDLLTEVLEYREDGTLWWRVRDMKYFNSEGRGQYWNDTFAGTRALGCRMANGYYVGSLFNTRFLAHRVVWAMFNGKWPEDQIDHINGERSDNRIENLRLASAHQNLRNMKVRKNTKSRFKGVSPRDGKWRAYIYVNGRHRELGRFATEVTAAKAYDAAARKHFGEFARLNFQ